MKRSSAKLLCWRLCLALCLGGLAVALAPGHAGRVAARDWIAELDQPCEGAPVGSFHVEVWFSGETAARASLDVSAEGCGHHRLDISPLVAPLEDQSPRALAQLRVWSVSLEGVRSDGVRSDEPAKGDAGGCGYAWAYLDFRGECGELGTGSAVGGDANRNGFLELTDALVMLQWLFLSGDFPCGDVDHNRDGLFDINDPVSVLKELFL